MSDNDEKPDDPITPTAYEAPKPGRRSEPWTHATSSDVVTPACLAAAHHVAHCERCLMALRAHCDDTIAEILSNITEHTH